MLSHGPMGDGLTEPLSGLKTSDGAFSVDLDQNILYWSSSAQQILGYSPEDVLGRPCYEVVGGRDSRNQRFCRRNCPVIANARRGRATQDYDILATTQDGTPVWINVSIILLERKHGRAPLVLHLFRDVTQRRRVEDLARRAMAKLRQLVEEEGVDEALEVDLCPTPMPHLSKREIQVLRLLTCGLGTGQIAESLGVSPITARNHITNLLNKLGAENRLQAVVYASQRRLV